jgi:hypothetical protein
MAVKFQGGKSVPMQRPVIYAKQVPTRDEILARLKGIGLFVGPSSESQSLTDKIIAKIRAIRFYEAEGEDALAKQEMANTVFGPKLREIVMEYTRRK